MLLPWLLLLSTKAYKVKESEGKEGRITNVDIFCIYSKWEGLWVSKKGHESLPVGGTAVSSVF